MKDFIGCGVPKKGPAEKLNLSTLCIYKQAVNKKAAEAIITGEFYQVYGDIAEHYFDLKVFEYVPGTDRPALNKWSTGFAWNKENGSVHLMPINEPDEPESFTEEVSSVMKLPTNFRAAVLALYGPVDGITKVQYGCVLDLVNDDEPSAARELAEAITRTPCILALHSERQAELLTAVRENVKETAQWTEIKKFMDKWLDTPPEKRESSVEAQRYCRPEKQSLPNLNREICIARTYPDAKPGNISEVMLKTVDAAISSEGVIQTRAFRVLSFAAGILTYDTASIYGVSRAINWELTEAIDVLGKEAENWLEANGKLENADSIKVSADANPGASTPISLNFSQKIAVAMYTPDITPEEVTAEILEAAMLELQNENPAFIRAQKSLTYIQAELEKFSDEQIFGAVRSVDFNTIQGNVMYRRTALNWLGVSGNNDEDEAEQNSQSATSSLGNGSEEAGSMEQNTVHTGEPTHEVKLGRSVFSLEELVAGPDDTRETMPDRAIEFAIAINDVLCGEDNIMSKDDTKELIALTGHSIEVVVGILIDSFIDAETTLISPAPALSNTEIYHLTLDALEVWVGDGENLSELIYNNTIDWRDFKKEQADRDADGASTDTDQMYLDARKTPPAPHLNTSPLTYHQRLTLAAIQGLCANPACFGSFDDIPGMADSLADGVLNIQGHPHE